MSNIGKISSDKSVEEMSIEELDALLVGSQKTSNKIGIIVLVSFIVIILSMIMHNTMLSVIGFIGFFGSLVCIMLAQRAHRVNEISDVIAQRTLIDVFGDAKFERKIQSDKRKCINKLLKKFYNRFTMTQYNHFEAEDHVIGTLNGVSFESADICAKYISDKNGHKKRITRFKGQYLRFQTSKKLSCDLFIRRKGEMELKTERDGGIKTDNPRFNKRWQVKSDNIEDALYVLTPQFMERLEEYEALISKELGVAGKTDYAFLRDGTVVVFTNTGKNLFELDVIATDENGKATGQTKTYVEIAQDFERETRWLRNVMNAIGVGQI